MVTFPPGDRPPPASPSAPTADPAILEVAAERPGLTTTWPCALVATASRALPTQHGGGAAQQQTLRLAYPRNCSWRSDGIGLRRIFPHRAVCRRAGLPEKLRDQQRALANYLRIVWVGQSRRDCRRVRALRLGFKSDVLSAPKADRSSLPTGAAGLAAPLRP